MHSKATLRAQFILLFFLFATSLHAHQGASPGWPLHDSSPDHAGTYTIGPQPTQTPDHDESCLLWTVAPSPAPTVNASTLQVPNKIRSEYKKGCSDLHAKKLSSAETHLRKAIHDYPNYPAAWVLLGQVLEAGNRLEEARHACSQASIADAAYAPAYLCLADISGQLQEWPQTLDLADHALSLDPVQGLYAYFYTAVAHFHLSHFLDAQKSAQETVDADRFHRLPQVHLLLAQIFVAQHDPASAAAQLRAYLKLVPNSTYAPAVKKSLADLESQLSK